MRRQKRADQKNDEKPLEKQLLCVFSTSLELTVTALHSGPNIPRMFVLLELTATARMFVLPEPELDLYF